MKLYIDNKLVRDYPMFRWRMGDRYMVFMVGFHLRGDIIAPIYSPLLRFFNHSLGMTIETPWIRFHFLRVPPFFDIELPQGEYLVEERIGKDDEQ